MTAIAALLKATPDEFDTKCVVSGWVRTKRDSKAGFSFLAINDGSSFDSIQVVADQSLPNYQSELLGLSTGCAVTVSGRLVASQGKGQSVEIQASEIPKLTLLRKNGTPSNTCAPSPICDRELIPSAPSHE